MNSISFPSVTQTLNSFNQPTISSTPLFKFKHTRVTISPVSTRSPNLSTKAFVSPAYVKADETETLYDLLGISVNGSLSEIKHAYKKMALKYHPDVSPPDRTEEYTVRFIRVQEAYETLSDPEARSEYDNCMAKGLPFSLSGKRETRFDPRSEDKNRWREMWTGQVSELLRKSGSGRVRVNRAKGMSWADRIRKQRSESCGSDSDQ